MKNKKIIFYFLSIFLVTACDNADTKTLSTFLIKNGNEWNIQIPNSWCAKKQQIHSIIQQFIIQKRKCINQ